MYSGKKRPIAAVEPDARMNKWIHPLSPLAVSNVQEMIREFEVLHEAGLQ